MRCRGPVRVVLAGALVAAAGLSGGGVSAAATSGATCWKVVSAAPVNGFRHSTLSACSPGSNTGGSGMMLTNIARHLLVISWNQTGTTKVRFTAVRSPKEYEGAAQSCPEGTFEVEKKGVVIGGSGAALHSIPMGWALSLDDCVSTKSGASVNEPYGSLSLAAPTTKCSTVVASASVGGFRHSTLSGCTRLTTGGSGKMLTNFARHLIVISWSNNSTTKVKFTATRSLQEGESSGQTCPAGTFEVEKKGVVIGGTAAALTSIPTGSPFSSDDCVTIETGAGRNERGEPLTL